MDMAYAPAMRLTTPNILEFLPLEEDYTIAQVEPAPSFIGKSPWEPDLHKRHEVNIIGVKESEPVRFVIVPEADFTVEENDLLSILGKESDLNKIRGLKSSIEPPATGRNVCLG